MKELLMEQQKAHELCGIYNDEDNPTQFQVGYVVGVSDEFVAIADLRPNGEWGGISIFEIDRIFKIELKSKYVRAIEMLNRKYSIPQWSQELFVDEDLFIALFEFAKNNGRMVTVGLISSEYDGIVGFIEDIRDGIVQMQAIDEYGDMDGSALFNINDVAYASIDSKDERKCEELFSINQTEKICPAYLK